MAGPAVFWLHRHRIPKLVAILAVVMAIVGFLTLVVNVAMFTLQDFDQNFPTYQSRLEEQASSLTEWLSEFAARFGLEHLG